MRPKAIITLLKSVEEQLQYPDEIIIVDGSVDNKTQLVIAQESFSKLVYFKVSDKDRGLTKQRNFGISKVSKDIDIVCFLDDDIVLTAAYFKNLINTYQQYPDAGGVGGYILDEVEWRKITKDVSVTEDDYEIDGYIRKLGIRNVIRKKLGLLSNMKPCIMPVFSNGFSVASLPPNGKIYIAEYFMGGVSSFTKEVVDTIKFSTYFEGYGLYEDLEYCLRVSEAVSVVCKYKSHTVSLS